MAAAHDLSNATYKTVSAQLDKDTFEVPNPTPGEPNIVISNSSEFQKWKQRAIEVKGPDAKYFSEPGTSLKFAKQIADRLSQAKFGKIRQQVGADSFRVPNPEKGAGDIKITSRQEFNSWKDAMIARQGDLRYNVSPGKGIVPAKQDIPLTPDEVNAMKKQAKAEKEKEKAAPSQVGSYDKPEFDRTGKRIRDPKKDDTYPVSREYAEQAAEVLASKLDTKLVDFSQKSKTSSISKNFLKDLTFDQAKGDKSTVMVQNPNAKTHKFSDEKDREDIDKDPRQKEKGAPNESDYIRLKNSNTFENWKDTVLGQLGSGATVSIKNGKISVSPGAGYSASMYKPSETTSPIDRFKNIIQTRILNSIKANVPRSKVKVHLNSIGSMIDAMSDNSITKDEFNKFVSNVSGNLETMVSGEPERSGDERYEEIRQFADALENELETVSRFGRKFYFPKATGDIGPRPNIEREPGETDDEFASRKRDIMKQKFISQSTSYRSANEFKQAVWKGLQGLDYQDADAIMNMNKSEFLDMYKKFAGTIQTLNKVQKAKLGQAIQTAQSQKTSKNLKGSEKFREKDTIGRKIAGKPVAPPRIVKLKDFTFDNAVSIEKQVELQKNPFYNETEVFSGDMNLKIWRNDAIEKFGPERGMVNVKASSDANTSFWVFWDADPNKSEAEKRKEVKIKGYEEIENYEDPISKYSNLDMTDILYAMVHSKSLTQAMYDPTNPEAGSIFSRSGKSGLSDRFMIFQELLDGWVKYIRNDLPNVKPNERNILENLFRRIYNNPDLGSTDKPLNKKLPKASDLIKLKNARYGEILQAILSNVELKARNNREIISKLKPLYKSWGMDPYTGKIPYASENEDDETINRKKREKEFQVKKDIISNDLFKDVVLKEDDTEWKSPAFYLVYRANEEPGYKEEPDTGQSQAEPEEESPEFREKDVPVKIFQSSSNKNELRSQLENLDLRSLFSKIAADYK